MSILDAAKDRATSLAAGVVNVVGDKMADKTPADATTGQSVTINSSVVEVEELWRDAARMSIVLGELGQVENIGPDRYRWNLEAGPVAVTWESTVHTEVGGLRFAGDDGNEILVSFRPAPNHLGTEVTLRTKTPAPDLLSGALAFKVLYRCRALLQTGEVPTIRKNPSARPSAR
ncbi:hypothetical protein NIIDNTM18_08290 [Mycolicibacterium litorale]|uniref:Cyclase n=1 Tax=Mycolicibacterium litorale TaxID=758802 RepID=A0A6S6P1X9_9MYCO|nr:hypothetical protein [Mycolicibacterium litorale]BCI51551.1 hypothetical protein NIIDNTM18_08290 [Mycolicibacterium litorale]